MQHKRLLAVIVAIISGPILLLWTWKAEGAIASYVWRHLALGTPISQAGGGRPDAYDPSAQPLYLLLTLAIVAAGMTISALSILDPERRFVFRAIIYVALLAIVLPLSWYNYNQNDLVVPPVIQALLNVLIAFLGGTVALSVGKPVANAAPDTRVLKILVVGLLTFAAVLVPLLLTTIWLLVPVVLSKKASQAITFAELTSIAGVISAVIAVITFLREGRKLAAEASAA